MDGIAVIAAFAIMPDILRAESRGLKGRERRRRGREIRRWRRFVAAMNAEIRETQARWRAEGLIP